MCSPVSGGTETSTLPCAVMSRLESAPLHQPLLPVTLALDVFLALQVCLPHLSDMFCAIHLGGHFVPLWYHTEEDLSSSGEPPV